MLKGRIQVKSWTSWLKANLIPLLLVSLILTGGSWFIWLWQHQVGKANPGYNSQELEALKNLHEENNSLQAELIKVKDELVALKNQQIDQGSVAGAKTEIPVEANSETILNLNKANASDLESLPGIGPSKAQSIIDYRNQIGSFSNKSQLLEVNGIGQKTYDSLKDLIAL
ncbi:helix-hairpin-helix domain-containing protein [Candidatus Berkelbacteria bacterium]|nr:helix-hairpin-helix domain-containing protein [Candidatus Berkelbacteria bacterium]